MNINHYKQGSFTIVRVCESRMDAATAPTFKQIMTQLHSSGVNRIVLDLSQVQFMDSSSLGALVNLLKLVGNRGDLIIAGAQGIVADLFKLTRMDRVFRMVTSVDAVLDAATA